ncbi:hypothetical protein ACFQ1M_08305 [Sungkyunkwania multivorans]|uniref:DUF3311 domain-containing protein n=1 Tax=Sungkyunkwania multivorans TaxID=1173618 RepID=A0ABW3CY31_9FLAO
MKKRHEQKLVVLSLTLLFLLNVPLVMIFDQEASFFGFPSIYFFIFLLWAVAILVSFLILKRHYE